MSIRLWRLCCWVLLLGTGLSSFANPLDAQGSRRTTLTLGGFPLTAPVATPVDFDAGALLLGSTSFTVDLTSNQGPAPNFPNRVTTVSVRCALPCPATGSAPAALEWRRSDAAGWLPLTTTYATVESRLATFNGANDPWSNGIAWRYMLGWETTPPAEGVAFHIQMQLTVTAP